MSSSTAETPQDSWSRLARTTGVAGLVAVVLLFGPIIAISTLGEPPFDATPDEAVEFFGNLDVGWAQAAEAAASLGMLAFLWFVVCLTTLLRRVEGDPAWRSTFALVSGTLVAAYGVLDASWDAAANRGSDLDPNIAAYAFDVGNLGFANAWLALGSFAIAVGLILRQSGALPAWWGWWAIVSGVGLVAARFVWEGSIWTSSVRLVLGLGHRPRGSPPSASAPARTSHHALGCRSWTRCPRDTSIATVLRWPTRSWAMVRPISSRTTRPSSTSTCR